MNRTERAAEIGNEHGKAAAEAWLDAQAIEAPYQGEYMLNPRSRVGWLLTEADGEDREAYNWPEPDLSGDYTRLDLRNDCGEYLDTRFIDGLVDAYSAAFTAAVEATVRADCEQVQS